MRVLILIDLNLACLKVNGNGATLGEYTSHKVFKSMKMLHYSYRQRVHLAILRVNGNAGTDDRHLAILCVHYYMYAIYETVLALFCGKFDWAFGLPGWVKSQ